MKYLAICLLALTALFSTSGSASTGSSDLANVPRTNLVPALIEPVSAFGLLHTSHGDLSPRNDGVLMLVLAGALVALQLRRRQKSMRMPRMLIT
jgi:hypothetical protein